ncbi:DUF2624 domain-containing protein [Bacillus shivajii]|uniref:DUF2624 family protein n=1 Tax=Bacillus shivajii TaxID=1983719 RepID=UPI001CFBCC9B|nr:DUF2624 family protein [Bacillus shivajii]UCZ54525.1 DUF2624 domain-containing protein [Bacillus shivajii]
MVNPVIRQMVNQRIRSLTAKELIRLAMENDIKLTVKQANEMLNILHKEPFDIGNEQLIKRVNRELKALDPSLYKKARKLLKPYEQYLDFDI